MMIQLSLLPSCEVLSWPGVIRADACAGGLVAFSALDASLSMGVWMLCEHHHETQTTCAGCGRQSAVGPHNLLSQCMDCTSAAHHGREHTWWIGWAPRRHG